MIHKLIKSWIFNEAERRNTMLMTAGVRLNAEEIKYPRLQLKESGSGFDTSSDLYVRTKLQKPNALKKWLQFQVEWRTNEGSFYSEYSLLLSNKSGNTFDYEQFGGMAKVGDKIYQGDYETTITVVNDTTIELADGTNFINGRVYALRSSCMVNIRLVDESNNMYFHNGADWVMATVSDWNTPFQVNNHIQDLDLLTFGKGIKFDINLKSNDSKYTPYVTSVDLLGEFDLDFIQDIIYDSLFYLIKEEINVTNRLTFALPTLTDTFDLNDPSYELSNDGYNFTAIVSAYNLTTDGERLNNIASSYTPGAQRPSGSYAPGIITFSSAQPADSIIEVELKYYPELAIFTNQDYYEVARMPSIVFESIQQQNVVAWKNSNIGKNVIRDKINLTATQVKSPEQFDLVFEYAVFTSNQSDQLRMGEALYSLFNRLRVVNSWGLDEPYPVTSMEVFNSQNVANTSNVNTHVGSFRIHNIAAFFREPIDVRLVGRLVNQLTTNQSRET